MKLRLLSIVLLIILLASYALLFPIAEQAWGPILKVQAHGMILPPLITKLFSLEFKSVAADFLFARATQYFGGKIAKNEPVDRNDMRWLYGNLVVITDLDPYFEDPYYFGNALFTWDAGMYNEANDLLKKASDARSWDWQFPFFLGFNKFYFLRENKEAADYLLIASKRPGAYNFLPLLASRLYNQERSTQAAVVFLKTFLVNERDKRIKKNLEMRLTALEGVLTLEQAVSLYKKRSGKLPHSLQSLLITGILKDIPKDPYGGVFYVERDGSIKTTSNFAVIPVQRENRTASGINIYEGIFDSY